MTIARELKLRSPRTSPFVVVAVVVYHTFLNNYFFFGWRTNHQVFWTYTSSAEELLRYFHLRRCLWLGWRTKPQEVLQVYLYSCRTSLVLSYKDMWYSWRTSLVLSYKEMWMVCAIQSRGSGWHMPSGAPLGPEAR